MGCMPKSYDCFQYSKGHQSLDLPHGRTGLRQANTMGMMNRLAATHTATMERLLLETSPDCVKLLDLDGRLVQINRKGCDALEIDDFEMLRNRPWPELDFGHHAA